MKYICLDLECNQAYRDGKRLAGLPQEIIEIGAVKLDENFKIISGLKDYIIPKFYNGLNPVVSSLLRINNRTLRTKGKNFNCVIESLKTLIKDEDITILTWGNDDVKILKNNLRMRKLDVSWLNNISNIDIQNIIKIQFKLLNPPNLKKFCIENKLDVNTNEHSAYSDALNLHKVVNSIVDKNILFNGQDILRRKYVRSAKISKLLKKELSTKVKCNTCNCETINIIIERPFAFNETIDKAYILSKCNNCDTIYSKEISRIRDTSTIDIKIEEFRNYESLKNHGFKSYADFHKVSKNIFQYKLNQISV